MSLNTHHIQVRARNTDPITSRLAANELEKQQTHLQQSVERVLELLLELGPVADFELRKVFLRLFGGSDSLPTKARQWAREKGLVRNSGRMSTNPKSGRKCVVWELGRDECYLEYTFVTCPTCGHKSRETNDRVLRAHSGVHTYLK